MLSRASILSVAATLALSSVPAGAGTIIGAVGATIDSSGPGFGSIADTFNQNGLLSNYIPGVTDFDSFVASTDHTWVFSGFEWFSNQFSTSAQVTYDLGSVFNIGKMALWNEESSGIGLLDLLISTDGITFVSLLSALVPTDHPKGDFNYGADVFSFVTTSFRYMRLAMSNCPQPDSDFQSCAIGEVAFDSVSVSEVPVPAAFPLLAAGLGALGVAGWRRQRRVVTA